MNVHRTSLPMQLCALLLVAGLSFGDNATEITANFTSDSPAFSHVLIEKSPVTDFELTLAIAYDRPGVVLDMVGLNAAKPGTWAVVIDPDGHIVFQVYGPQFQSPWHTASGWHVMRSVRSVAPNTIAIVTMEVRGLDVAFTVDGAEPLTMRLGQPLLDQPVWVGDFPGDDHWGEGHAIHPAFTGRLLANLRSGPQPQAPATGPAAPPATETAPLQTSSASSTPTAEGDLQAAASKLEAALRAADLDTLTALIHPSRREMLSLAMTANAEAMPKLGEWFGQRSLKRNDNVQAEYEVIVDETALTVKFVKSDEEWWLLSL